MNNSNNTQDLNNNSNNSQDNIDKNGDIINVVRYDKIRKRKIFSANHIFSNSKNNYIQQERQKKIEIAKIELEKKNKRLQPLRSNLNHLHLNITNMKHIPKTLKLAYLGLKQYNLPDQVCKNIIKNNILLPSSIIIYNLFYNYVFPYKFAFAIEIAKKNKYIPSLMKEFINKFYTPYLKSENLSIPEDKFVQLQCKNIIDIPHNIKNKRMLERFLHKEPEYAIDFIGIIFKYNSLTKLQLQHIFMDNNED
tara:strand:- start:846 stop:1595 length:750 start_codon:yes stop_codon:yes gene_type:complete